MLTSNRACQQVPGRVGDGSVPGGGAYADSEVGACGATGDGDVHLRFLPCYQVGGGRAGPAQPTGALFALRQRGVPLGPTPWPASLPAELPTAAMTHTLPSHPAAHSHLHSPQVVENMRRGMKPRAAAEDAVLRIARRVPSYVGAVFAVDRAGNHGAACYGWQFKYAYRDARSEVVVVVAVDPLPPQPPAARGPAADGGDA